MVMVQYNRVSFLLESIFDLGKYSAHKKSFSLWSPPKKPSTRFPSSPGAYRMLPPASWGLQIPCALPQRFESTTGLLRGSGVFLDAVVCDFVDVVLGFLCFSLLLRFLTLFGCFGQICFEGCLCLFQGLWFGFETCG